MCKRCHKVRIDKRAGLEMCQRCKRITLEERRRERHAIRARKALRLQGVAPQMNPLPERPTVPEPNGTARKTYRPNPEELGQELLLEIGAHYEDHRIPAEKIALAYGISNGMLSAAVDLLGLPRRARGAGPKPPGRFGVVDGKRTWLLDEPEIPEAQHKALENMLTAPVYGSPQPGRTRLEPKPEPPVVRRAEPVFAQTERWAIKVEGWLALDGDGLEQIVAQVRAAYPGLNISELRREP